MRRRRSSKDQTYATSGVPPATILACSRVVLPVIQVVLKNGEMAVNFEHSYSDGMIWARMLGEVGLGTSSACHDTAWTFAILHEVGCEGCSRLGRSETKQSTARSLVTIRDGPKTPRVTNKDAPRWSAFCR